MHSAEDARRRHSPFPAFNRVLGQSLDELAAKVALESAARS
jgi:hypothetical protein